MKDTLDMVGDGDDVDIVVDAERTFGIKVTDEEAERTRTVGQLYDLIEMKRPNAGSRTQACLSQIAFYRLRRAVKAMGIESKLTPQTPIAVIEGIEPHSIALKWRRLAQSSGLDLPRLETRFRRLEQCAGIFLFLAVLGGALAAFGISLGISVVLLSGFVAVPLLGLAVLYAWWRVFRTVPRRLVTIGELAREAAGCGFTKLTAEKKGCGPSDRWFALTAMLHAHTGHQIAITRETTFFAMHAGPVP